MILGLKALAGSGDLLMVDPQAATIVENLC